MVCSLRGRTQVPKLYFDGNAICNVRQHRHLGIILSHDMTWQKHIEDITIRANKRLDVLSRLSHVLDRKSLTNLYISFIRPTLEYGDILYNGCTEYQSKNIERVQKRAARIITGGIRGTSAQVLYAELGWISMKERRDFHCLCLLNNIINGRASEYLKEQLPNPVGVRTTHNLRNSANISLMAARTSLFQRSFFPSTIKLWNNLDKSTSDFYKISEVKRKLLPKKYVNPRFSLGQRKLNIIWSRIRLGCSSLNAQLYVMNIVNDPTCACGYNYEDANLFFFTCPLYNRKRQALTEAFSRFNIHLDLHVILHGSDDLNDHDNKIIIQCVLDYIQDSNRFA